MAPSGMRFISPDGRPLSQLLDGNRDDADSGRAKRGSHRSRKSSGSKAEQRWERAMHQGGGGGGGVLPGGRSEAEELELEVGLAHASLHLWKRSSKFLQYSHEQQHKCSSGSMSYAGTFFPSAAAYSCRACTVVFHLWPCKSAPWLSPLSNILIGVKTADSGRQLLRYDQRSTVPGQLRAGGAALTARALSNCL